MFRNPGKCKQQGSSLVIAIFIIVVLLLLATVLVRILSSGAQSVAYEVIGTRAFAAAQAGANRQLQQLFPLGGAVNRCGDINATAPDWTNVEGLAGCTVVLSCTDLLHTDGITYYSVESTGQCNAGEVSTSRTVKVDARSLN